MMKNNINKIKMVKPVANNEDSDEAIMSGAESGKVESPDISPIQEYFDSLTDEEKQELCEIVKAYEMENGGEDDEKEIDLDALVKENSQATEDN